MKKIMLLVIMVCTTLSAKAEQGFYEKKISQTAVQPGERSVIEFQVLDKAGQLRYSLTKSLDYDIPHPVLKSWDEGGAVLLNSFEGSVEFYTADGFFNRKVILSGHPSSPYEQSLYGCPSGDKLAIALCHPAGAATLLTILDRAGNTLQQSDINLTGISMLAYDARSDRTALSGIVWMGDSMAFRTVVLHSLHQIEGDLTCHLIGGFYDNQSRLWGWNKKSAFCLSQNDDNSTGRFPLEVYRVPDQEIMLDMVWGAEGITLLTSDIPTYRDGAWQYDNLRLIKLDDQGAVAASHDISPVSSIRLGLVSLDGKLFIRTDQDIMAIPSF